MMKRCVLDFEMKQVMDSCHSSTYGGHHGGERTAHKVLQSGFFWPTLFRDAAGYVKSCD